MILIKNLTACFINISKIEYSFFTTTGLGILRRNSTFTTKLPLAASKESFGDDQQPLKPVPIFLVMLMTQVVFVLLNIHCEAPRAVFPGLMLLPGS